MQFPLRFLPHKKIERKQNKIPQFNIMDAYSITGLIQKNVLSHQWNYNLSSLSLIAALPFWHFLKINYIFKLFLVYLNILQKHWNKTKEHWNDNTKELKHVHRICKSCLKCVWRCLSPKTARLRLMTSQINKKTI